MTLEKFQRRLFVRFNILAYKLFPNASSQARGKRHLLLTTIGAQTGMPRTQPLTCMVDGEDLFVVASNWGSGRLPAWWYNLKANPLVDVQLGSERRPMRARFLSGRARSDVWPRLIAYNQHWATYQAAVGAELPVVRLSPVASALEG